MLLLRFIVLCLLLATTAVSALAASPEAAAPPPEKKIEFVEYDLASGLHVILHQNHSAPVIATYVLYHVGSKDERPDRTGFAHFFEHLMFEGSENIPRGRVDKLISGAGGNLNASTSFDFTDYHFNLPSNQLALWIESERMLHTKVDETGVKTQRQVVKEERRREVENRPYGTFFENFAAMVFVIGNRESCRPSRRLDQTSKESAFTSSIVPALCSRTSLSRQKGFREATRILPRLPL